MSEAEESATARKLAAAMDDNKALWARIARLEAALKAGGIEPLTVGAALRCLVENRITLGAVPADLDHVDLLDVVTALNGIIPELKMIRARAKP